jgi:hypothetical protein
LAQAISILLVSLEAQQEQQQQQEEQQQQQHSRQAVAAQQVAATSSDSSYRTVTDSLPSLTSKEIQSCPFFLI